MKYARLAAGCDTLQNLFLVTALQKCHRLLSTYCVVYLCSQPSGVSLSVVNLLCWHPSGVSPSVVTYCVVIHHCCHPSGVSPSVVTYCVVIHHCCHPSGVSPSVVNLLHWQPALSSHQSVVICHLFIVLTIDDNSLLPTLHHWSHQVLLRWYLLQNLIYSAYLVNQGCANFQKTAWMWITCIPRLRIKVWKFCEIITFLRPLAGRRCQWTLIFLKFTNLQLTSPLGPVNKPIGSYQIQHLKVLCKLMLKKQFIAFWA